MFILHVQSKNSFLFINSENLPVTRKVFLLFILNFIHIFNDKSQWRMTAKFKVLSAELKMESYKFVLNKYAGFTEMKLYPPLAIVNKQHRQHQSVSEKRVAFIDETLISFQFFANVL